MLNLDKVIIWGLRDTGHTHSFIHAAFFKAFKHMGYETHWFNTQEEANAKCIDLYNSFYLFIDLVDSGIMQLPPLDNSCFYFCHHLDKQKQRIVDAVAINNVVSWSVNVKQFKAQYNFTHNLFDEKENVMFFSWGTDLLPHEIQKNIDMLDLLPKPQNTIFHVGSLTNGWEVPYVEYMQHMKKYDIEFQHFGPHSPYGLLTEEQNQELIKNSFAAPALQFKWQVDNEYIPCRIFKSISYGKMGITNSKAVHDLFHQKTLYSADLEDLARQTYEFEQNPDKDRIKELMIEVRDKHTYVSRIEMIFKYLHEHKNVTISVKQ